MFFSAAFWYILDKDTPAGHSAGRADVLLYYPGLTHNGLLLHGLASANMKIVGRQRNIYIFCNISMNLTIFCISLSNSKTAELCVEMLASLCICYVSYCILQPAQLWLLSLCQLWHETFVELCFNIKDSILCRPYLKETGCDTELNQSIDVYSSVERHTPL